MLDTLIKSAWNAYQALKSSSFVVKDAVPILWFGDSKSYAASQRRIVTVGLNPSNMEFQDGTHSGTGVRFPKALPLVGLPTLSPTDIATYAAAMDDYFNPNPYWRWFTQYNKILNLLNASYDGKQGAYTAIHIDAYTPIATNPTWGGLSESDRKSLHNPTLFIDLLSALEPDIILISANRTIVESLFGSAGWTTFKPATPKKRAYVKTKQCDGQLIIWGHNMMGTPFGGMTSAELQLIFDDIKVRYGIRS